MPPIRIVLATLSPLVADIVRRLLSGHLDLEVAAGLASASEIDQILCRHGAEVVVAGALSADDRETLINVLRKHAGLRLIVIAADARVATVYELRLHETAIADVSPADLLQVIRRRSAGIPSGCDGDRPSASISGATGSTPSPPSAIRLSDDTQPTPQQRTLGRLQSREEEADE